jgi:hypothetical protein
MEQPFYSRFYQYQKERFPFLQNGLVIAIFTFSAISYSIISRGAAYFVAWNDFGIAIFQTISFFFLVRLFDEIKDHEDDVKYRNYLPVPRGLISLNEIKWMAMIVIALQVSILLLFQREMFILYALVFAYLLLMLVEFFIPKWLKKRQIAYITSHMFVIPLVDLYASGIDWKLAGVGMHWGLAWFFAVSYFNGIVLEFGRKLRPPNQEEPGVVSYTQLYGTKGGVFAWLGVLIVTFFLAIGAALYADFHWYYLVLMIAFFAICATPGLLFLKQPTQKNSKKIELFSAIWTALMYLNLGAAPMVHQLFVA